ncbi:TadE/TadG family type IV pilus assembly protein [Streptomyces sp. NBC_01264]|uniref:TadE/TadG family type IV pilus assembly protein n=1 Tax=Streptomyces sp. NBC_01264 TaxID=2903804 RepID=UPI00224C7D2E|nr:TadE/TadG family type IV pilus assembly protein [Streptomyces sp. NBC_01264]MCX4780703.1 pilus assembly protein [Streptomyces sp. NBC_01264]
MNRIRAIRGGDRDRGQVALEYIGFLPFLLLLGLGGIQLGWTAYVTQQAQTAARTAARVEARYPGEGVAAGLEAIRPNLVAGAVIERSVTRDSIRMKVTLTINSVVPGIGSRPVERTAVMPNDDPR